MVLGSQLQMTGIERVIKTQCYLKQWDQCFHVHKYVWLPQGRCACLPSPAHKGDHTNTGLELQFPHEAAGQVSWFVTQLSGLPRLSLGPLDLGAGGPARALPPSSRTPAWAMNLMRGSEVMARSAHQASDMTPGSKVHSVHRGQGAHCVRKHSSLLTDIYWAGWIQLPRLHFPWLLWPNYWGFERRGGQTKLAAFKNCHRRLKEFQTSRPQALQVLVWLQSDSWKRVATAGESQADRFNKLWTWWEIRCYNQNIAGAEESIMKAKSHYQQRVPKTIPQHAPPP